MSLSKLIRQAAAQEKKK
jgi:Mitochondrial carrier protein